MTRLNITLLLAELEDLPPPKLEIVLEYVFDKLPEEYQKVFIQKHTMKAEEKATQEALANIVQDIDHEVERLAHQVREGELSHEQAAFEFALRSSHEMLIRRSPNTRQGIYKDFRISPEPGWACMRRAIWGTLRLLSYPVSNIFAGAQCIFVDYATGSSRPVPTDEDVPDQPENTVRVVAVSDTHLRHRDLFLPEGDILVHCGDVLLQGGDVLPPRAEGAEDRAPVEAIQKHLQDFEAWLVEQRSKFADVIVLPGNHDRALEEAGAEVVKSLLPSATYLSDSGTEVSEGRLSVWGTGYSLGHGGYNTAFQYDTVAEAQDVFDRIPGDGSVQLLLTHGPPELKKADFIRDDQARAAAAGKTFGCPSLLEVVKTRVRPLVHIFGHDHTNHGATRLAEGDCQTLFICATSVVDGTLAVQNPPIVVDIPVTPNTS